MDITKATYTAEMTVQENHLAMNVGSGDLPVLGTPVMMALMEHAAMKAVAPQLDEGTSTVGGHIESSHLRPTGLGANIRAKATLVKEEGRKLTFHIVAEDEQGVIGEGEHLRFIVDKQKFLSKITQSK